MSKVSAIYEDKTKRVGRDGQHPYAFVVLNGGHSQVIRGTRQEVEAKRAQLTEKA